MLRGLCLVRAALSTVGVEIGPSVGVDVAVDPGGDGEDAYAAAPHDVHRTSPPGEERGDPRTSVCNATDRFFIGSGRRAPGCAARV